MAKMLYVDPDEEITELVERIRAAGDESDLVFIFPSHARVLLSPLNLRLLQQYSRSNLKSTAIVTGDPRVQGLAREAGFATYASVQAYERGVQVMRPITEGSNGDGVAAGAAADLASEPLDDDTWADPVPPPLPAGAMRSRGTAPRPPLGADRRRLYMVAGGVFVVGFLLLFLVAPSAKVTITLKATPVELTKQIQGTSDPTSAQGPDRVLTKAVTDDESQQFDAKPTGQKQIQAVAASGGIVLTTDEPYPFCASNGFPRGTEFSTSGARPVKFVVSQDTTNTPDGQYCVPAATAGAPVSSAPPIPVTAEATGAAGNVSAGAINQWLPPPNSPPGTTTGNPCGDQTQPGRRCDLSVTNPGPTGGGVDQHNVVVVSDTDFKSYNDQVAQIKQQLSDKARKAMQDHAQGDVFAIDPSQQGLTLSTEVNPPVPNSGDEFKETNITVTVHGRAAAYNPDDVRRVFTTDLSSQIPQGETLVEQHLTGPDIQQASDDGTVVFSIRGTGFSQPIVDLNKLKETFTGQGEDAVGRKVRAEFGDQASTSISRTIPFFVLPFFSSRISVDVRVVAEGVLVSRPLVGVALGLDAGTVRIGLAATDPTATIAGPVATLSGRDRAALWTRVREEAASRGAERLVVGLPRRLDGSEGDAAVRARAFADEASRQTGLPVEMWDERLSTVAAERALIEGGMRRARRRETVDSVAAAIMLQNWLDARRWRADAAPSGAGGR